MPKSDFNKVAHFPLKATLLKSHLKPRLSAEKLCEESAVQLINKSTRNSCRCKISTVSSAYLVSVYLSIYQESYHINDQCSPSYKNQSTNLQCKSVDWFLDEGQNWSLWVKTEADIEVGLGVEY